MGDDGSSSQSFLRRHWEGYKEFWGERFSFLENYTRFSNRDKALPSWSSADVEEFIASDPVHGPVHFFTRRATIIWLAFNHTHNQLKTTREAVSFGLTGSAIGALSAAAVTLKYSKSLHGAGMSFVACGAFGFAFGQEVANHWLQLYRLDTLGAQTKFMEWWESKAEGRS